MNKHAKARHCSVLVLALLAGCGLGVFAYLRTEPRLPESVNRSPEPRLPEIVNPRPESRLPEIVKAWRDAGFEVGSMMAWRDAGFEVGWMKDVPPQSSTSGFWVPWSEEREAGAIPAFGWPKPDAGRVLTNLPDPGTAFGLDFHCGSDAGVTLKELAKLKSLQSLNIGAVNLNNLPERQKAFADLKELAEFRNLRALYLFYLPVTDADLKHVAALKTLQVLDLSNTSVTDLGLKELARLKELQWLNLTFTEVTAKGVAALRTELPKCKITVRKN